MTGPQIADHSPLALKFASRFCQSASENVEGSRNGSYRFDFTAGAIISSSKQPSSSHLAGYGQNFRSCFDLCQSATNAWVLVIRSA